MKYYLAVDIGASSGRLILGHREEGKMILEEVHRFGNGMEMQNGHLTWDVDQLFAEIITGMKKCAFCKHYFDPTFEVIAPKRGIKDVWEYERGVKKPCLLRNNREMQSQMTCPKFEVRI